MMFAANKIRLGAAGLAAALACGAAPCFAQLEEVVVTARKKAEPLQTVPIAITALSGSELRGAGIATLEAAAPGIPNFHHAQAAISSDIFVVRGIGTIGSSAGFEQAVGRVFNGFFYGRSRLGRSAFMDMERLELLKGPQGAIIGKNTSAGAINISSNKPTAEFEGYLSGNYNFEASEGYTLEGAASGPIGDSARGRAAFRLDDKDGWTENNNTGAAEQSKEDLSARLILDVDLSDSFSAELLYQYGKFRRLGRNREWSRCSPANRAAIIAQDPKAECDFDGARSTVFVYNGETRGEPHDTDLGIFGATLTLERDAFTIISLSNWSDYQVFDMWDIDQSTAERTNGLWEEDFSQFSQELRIHSAGGGALDYIAGLYFQRTALDYFAPFDFHRGADSGRRVRDSEQDSETLAVFAQVDWRLAAAWTLTLGGRYTDESKDGFTQAWYAPLYDPAKAPEDAEAVLLAPGAAAPGFSGATRVIEGDASLGFRTLTNGPLIGDNALRGEIDDADFSPNASLQWHVAAGGMLYLNYAKGFKGAGFDLQSVTPSVDNPMVAYPFDSESSTHFELGGKHAIGGRARFNWALFRTKFEDMQVTSLDGISLRQTVSNAASATVKGLEFELAWAPADAFNLGLSLGWIDAAFDTFAAAPCWAGQTAAQGCGIVDVGSGAMAQDLSGEPLPYAPELSWSLDADYAIRIGQGGLQLVLAAQYYWIDDAILQLDADANNFQESYGKLNASLRLQDAAGNWSAALLGRNLTNEFTANYSNDTAALTGGINANGTHYSFLEETRAIALQVRWNF